MSRNLRLLPIALLAVLAATAAGRSLAQQKAAAVRMLSRTVISSLHSEPLTQSRFRPAVAVAAPATSLERVEAVATRQRPAVRPAPAPEPLTFVHLARCPSAPARHKA